MPKMVDSSLGEGSATATVAADRGNVGDDGSSGGEDAARRLVLVLGEHLVPIRESLEAAGQNLSGLRIRFAAMEATLGGLLAAAETDAAGGGGHVAGCAARLVEARRAVEELSASREAGRTLRDDNALLRRDLQLQRGRQGVASCKVPPDL